MKIRFLLLSLAATALLCSCGTMNYYSSDAFDDGIYYRPDRSVARVTVVKETAPTQPQKSVLAEAESDLDIFALAEGETYEQRLTKFSDTTTYSIYLEYNGWYDPWYNPWWGSWHSWYSPYRPGYYGWHMGMYSPWCYDPWYYDSWYYSGWFSPWYYNPWLYAGWYDPFFYGPHIMGPGHHGHHPGSGPGEHRPG
ncbi:MAG: hypothetical protein HUJ93_01500 [Bacteroidales bacterium]|nr:hypothetical protein [Bacteroidales bacterium]